MINGAFGVTVSETRFAPKQRKGSASSAPSQPNCKQQKCILYLSHVLLQLNLSQITFTTGSITYSIYQYICWNTGGYVLFKTVKVFQIGWIPGAKKVTWRQSYWVASWCYSNKPSIKILEYIMKNIAWILFKGGKKQSVLFTLLWSISAFQSHTRDLMDTKSGYF